jgi:hypothetical protein
MYQYSPRRKKYTVNIVASAITFAVYSIADVKKQFSGCLMVNANKVIMRGEMIPEAVILLCFNAKNLKFKS